MRTSTKKQMTKQAMIQVLVDEERKAWNGLMYAIWYYAEEAPEVKLARREWSVLSNTLYLLGVEADHSTKRLSTINIPSPVQG